MVNVLKTLVRALALGVAANPVFAVKPPLYREVDLLIRDLAVTGHCSSALPALAYKPLDPSIFQTHLNRCKQNLKQKLVSLLDLGPVHLAVMGKNLNAIAPMVQAGAIIDERDFQGFTPLHHAAMMGYQEGVQKLLGLKADPLLRTNYGATYMDFLRMNAPFTEPYPLDKTLFSTHTNENYPPAPQCLGNGVVLTHENVARPETLIHLWENSVSELTDEERKDFNPLDLERIQTYYQKYIEFKANPPALRFEQVTHDDSRQPLAVKLCGLFAGQDIKQGDMIGEYVGEILTPDQANAVPSSKRDYLWNDPLPHVDPRQYRGAMAMANEGFPNAYLQGLEFNDSLKFGLDGLFSRKLIFAMEEIKEGEQILIDYGPGHKMKYGERLEMRPQAMLNFFRTHPWGDIFAWLKEVHSNPKIFDFNEHTEAKKRVDYVTYVVNTPKALQILIDNKLYGLADLGFIQKAVDDPDFDFTFRKILKNALPILKAALIKANKHEDL